MDITKLNVKSSIKTKLLAVIIPIVAIVITLLITISYYKSKDIITNSANELLEDSSKNQMNQINSWLNENLTSFQSVKTSIESSSLSGDKLQIVLNNYYKYNNNYPNGFYIGDENGNIMKAKDSDKIEKNAVNSIWYKDGLTRVNMGFGSAYKNEQGKDTISASAILNDGSGKLKVLATDLYLDKISIIVNSSIGMKDAEAFLVDNRDKTILAYKDSSLISTKLGSNTNDKFLKAVAAKLDSGQVQSVELEDNMVVFKQIEGTDWTLVSYVPTKSVFGELSKLRTFTMVIAVISIIILMIMIERILHIVIKPIKNLNNTILSMTNGDFTVDVEVKGNDEISEMLKNVKGFIEVMRNMIKSIGVVSNKMNAQAEDGTTISKELYNSSKVQTESMKNLNATVSQLSSSINEIAESTTTLAQVISNTKDDSINVNSKMEETINISGKGKQDMEKVSKAMENIRKSIDSLGQAINNVGKSSAEITNIVGVIGSIAEQTNLLSLNASIEAARAGDAGKGFSVVATEIGHLAQTSSESVKNISELINGIEKLVSDTVKQSKENAEYINESSYLISNSVDTFDNIFATINETNNLIQGMIEKVGSLDDVAATVAAISEEQAASSEEILATSEVMVDESNTITENSEKVAIDAENLSTTSEELAKQVQSFKV